MIDYLLKAGYEVDAFFRTGKDFIENHTTNVYLEKLVARGLNFFIVEETHLLRNYKLGLDFVKAAHCYDLCAETVRKHKTLIDSATGCISTDMGWMLALAETDKKKILSILGDPMHSKLRYVSADRISAKILKWARIISMFNLYPRLKPCLKNKNLITGIFSPHHAKEIRRGGIDCKDVPFSTPVPSKIKTNYDINPAELVLLHVGNLLTTASTSFIKASFQDVLAQMGKLPFKICFRFVGRHLEGLDKLTVPSNVTVERVGYLNETEIVEEYVNADIFYAPIEYPIGTRTRIMTALSYGLPIIATEANVRDSMPGVDLQRDLFVVNKTRSVVDVLKFVHSNQAVLKDVGQCARKAWERNYNPDVNMPKLMRILES
ncbi:MAG: glycosyltransferase [Nitrospirae bacterium]|nr:glycosyltransferase [Nitrospirota bacterium]